MSTTCFVTGAGGFVGRALVNSLLAQGNHVRALDVRFPSDWLDDATRLWGDICDRALLEQGCRDAEFVFHCAALLPQRHAAPAVMWHTNVEGAQHLFNAALRARVSRVVMLSSAEVYGVPAMVPCPEEAPQRPLGEYGRNKVEAEQLARDASHRGLQVVILRPPTVVGPTMTDRVLLTTLTALRNGWPVVVPGGTERFQMVALSDLVDACLAASRANGVAGEAFNIGADAVPSQQQVFRELRTRMGSRSPVIPVPRSLLRGLFRFLLALGRSPLEPEHVPIALADYVFDIRKARDRLAWRPAKGNVDALADAYRWLAGAAPAAVRRGAQ
ncbi:MAG: NAD-dependent epimerase/dehydratase family protein [Candidatus Binatia bacterium]